MTLLTACLVLIWWLWSQCVQTCEGVNCLKLKRNYCKCNICPLPYYRCFQMVDFLSPNSHCLLSLILFSFPFFLWQERFQVKNPPHTYLQKLRSYLDPAVTRKVSALAKKRYPVPAAWPFHCSGFSFPSDPLSRVRDIPLLLRKDSGADRFGTLVTKQSIVWERRQLFIWNAPFLRNICPVKVSLSKTLNPYQSLVVWCGIVMVVVADCALTSMWGRAMEKRVNWR